MMFGESFSFISVAYRDDLILPSPNLTPAAATRFLPWQWQLHPQSY